MRLGLRRDDAELHPLPARRDHALVGLKERGAAQDLLQSCHVLIDIRVMKETSRWSR
jgi:hypothetical protein